MGKHFQGGRMTSIRTKIASIVTCVSLNHKELAEAIGVSARTVYNWLNGQPLQPGHQSKIDAAAAIAEWSNCGEHLNLALRWGYLGPRDLLQHLMVCSSCRQKWNHDWMELYVKIVADGEYDLRVLTEKE
jgi:transcriptional regulator with XRE-family HTH domain